MYRINEEKLILDWEIERKPIAFIMWSDSINSTPIEDLRSWQMSLAKFCGDYGNIIEFSGVETYNYIRQSQETKKLEIIDLRLSNLSNLLYGNPIIVINNELDKVKVIIKSTSNDLPGYYKDLEATVF